MSAPQQEQKTAKRNASLRFADTPFKSYLIPGTTPTGQLVRDACSLLSGAAGLLDKCAESTLEFAVFNMVRAATSLVFEVDERLEDERIAAEAATPPPAKKARRRGRRRP